jgi:hypothetical protein
MVPGIPSIGGLNLRIPRGFDFLVDKTGEAPK